MDFDPTFIPPIMLIIVGVGWMLVWAFGRHGEGDPGFESRGSRDLSMDKCQVNGSDPSTDSATLLRLAGDQDYLVRFSVATNPSSAAHVLERLASDSHHAVRFGVAQNLSTPAQLLQILTSDSHQKVRTAALGNPNSPSEIANPGSIRDSKADELIKLAELRDSGVLTEQEFASEKAKILGT